MVQPCFSARVRPECGESPIIRYWKWYKNYPYDGGHPAFLVEVSSDSAKTWTTLESYPHQTDGWEKTDIPIGDMLSGRDNVRFRFTATDASPNQTSEDIVVEALMDDFEVLGVSGTVTVRTGGAMSQPGIVYAASPMRLSEVNPADGTLSCIDSAISLDIRGLAIRPASSELLGVVPSSSNCTIYGFDAVMEYPVVSSVIPVSSMRAIAFLDDTTLIGAGIGRIYRITYPAGDTVGLRTYPGLQCMGLSVHPQTGEVWASAIAGSRRDLVLKINPVTGDTTEVGRAGDNCFTTSIAFASDGTLYGLRGTGNEKNSLVLIDLNTSHMALACSTSATGLTAIAIGPDVTEAVAVLPGVPMGFRLDQNYPNPFNPTTAVRFQLPVAGDVKIVVYDVLGREVSVLVSEKRNAGISRGQVRRFWPGKRLVPLQAGGWRFHTDARNAALEMRSDELC